MNYSVTGEQLTAIADAIRAKTGNAGQGKNKLNPTTLKAAVSVSSDTKYTFSGDLVFTSSSPLVEIRFWFSGVYSAVGQVFEPVGQQMHDTYTFTVPAGTTSIDVSFRSGVASYSNLQIEIGEEETTYEAFTDRLEFPSGFVSAIESI